LKVATTRQKNCAIKFIKYENARVNVTFKYFINL
jgi:hypothetical protein